MLVAGPIYLLCIQIPLLGSRVRLQLGHASGGLTERRQGLYEISCGIDYSIQFSLSHSLSLSFLVINVECT